MASLRYLILCMVALSFPSSKASAYVSSLPIFTGDPAFANSNWYVEANQNRPIGHTGNVLLPGKLTYTLGFRYFYEPDWLMGASLGFRSFFEKTPEENELTYFSFTHEAYRVVRIYHPTYLLVGARFAFMMPATTSRLPIARYSKYETEIGAGLSFMLSHHLSQRLSLHVRADRWRGTKTNELHAIEASAGVTYRVP